MRHLRPAHISPNIPFSSLITHSSVRPSPAHITNSCQLTPRRAHSAPPPSRPVHIPPMPPTHPTSAPTLTAHPTPMARPRSRPPPTPPPKSRPTHALHLEGPDGVVGELLRLPGDDAQLPELTRMRLGGGVAPRRVRRPVLLTLVLQGGVCVCVCVCVCEGQYCSHLCCREECACVCACV